MGPFLGWMLAGAQPRFVFAAPEPSWLCAAIGGRYWGPLLGAAPNLCLWAGCCMSVPLLRFRNRAGCDVSLIRRSGRPLRIVHDGWPMGLAALGFVFLFGALVQSRVAR